MPMWMTSLKQIICHHGTMIQGSKGEDGKQYCLKKKDTDNSPWDLQLNCFTLSSRSEGWWNQMESTLNVPQDPTMGLKLHRRSQESPTVEEVQQASSSLAHDQIHAAVYGIVENKMKWCLAHLWNLGKWHVLKNSEVAEILLPGNLQDGHRFVCPKTKDPQLNSFLLRQQAPDEEFPQIWSAGGSSIQSSCFVPLFILVALLYFLVVSGFVLAASYCSPSSFERSTSACIP